MGLSEGPLCRFDLDLGTASASAPRPGRNPALEAAGRCWGASRADQGRCGQAQARLTVSSPALLHAACPELVTSPHGPHGTATAVRLRPQPCALTPPRAEGFVRGLRDPAGPGVRPVETPPSGGDRAQPLPDFPVQPWAPSLKAGGFPPGVPHSADGCCQAEWGCGVAGGCCQLTPSWSLPSTPMPAAGTEPGIALPMGGSWGAPLCGSSAVPPAAPARPADGAHCPSSWPAPRPACHGPSSSAPAVPAGGRSPGRGRCSWMGQDVAA